MQTDTTRLRRAPRGQATLADRRPRHRRPALKWPVLKRARPSTGPASSAPPVALPRDRRRAPQHRQARRWRWHRPRTRWIVLGLVAALLLPPALSYERALTGPGTDALSVRSVEWVRQHHGRSLVNAIENFWYSHHKPKAGGTPKHGLPSAATVPGSRPRTQVPDRLRPVPAPIVPIASPALDGEGQWKPLGASVHGQPAMFATFLRPDTVHTSLVTAVAWLDPNLVRTVGFAGVQEPGGGPWHNQAPIPLALRPSLLAAFNSGFRMMDSRGGYFAEGRVLRPLRDGAATLVISPDGTPSIGQWGRDFHAGPSVSFARQNLLLIVDQGQPVPGIDHDSTIKWGATLGNAQLVWRSGIGQTANGALVYAAGNGLSAGSLAHVLASAGAVRAMELDINSTWVDFFTYGPAPPGQPAGNLSVTKLLPAMRPPLDRYFTASSRDFIAIFSR